MATETARRSSAILCRPRSGSIQGAFRQSRYIIFAMLVDARVACQPMAGIQRHNFALPFFTGGEHLDDRRVGNEFYSRASGSGIEETGAGGVRFTTVPSGAITSMGFNAPWFFGRS